MAKANTQNFEQEILKYVKDNLSLSKNKTHSFDHTERVYNIAMNIAASENNVDLDVIKAAALLHDIARDQENKTGKCHAEEGAKAAQIFLVKIGFPKEKIDKVCTTIQKHRSSKKIKAETIEEKILQDADRLDAIGAIGTARTLAHGSPRILYDKTKQPKRIYDGYSETTYNHLIEKILKIDPATFNTKNAKKIAEARHNFVNLFAETFIDEWNGEK